MRHVLVVPHLGESIVEVTVLRLLKQTGERVERDEPLYEVETVKATMEIESPATGRVSTWLVAEGDTVPPGTEIAHLELTDPVDPPPRDGEDTDPTDQTAGPIHHTDREGRPAPRANGPATARVAPRLRALARELGISDARIDALATEHGPPRTAQDIDSWVTPARWTDHPISPARQQLNQAMEDSAARTVPALVATTLDQNTLRRATDALHHQSGEPLFATEFTALAHLAARTTADHPALRTRRLGNDSLRTFGHLSLGIAVGDGKDLFSAVVPQADQLTFTSFVAEYQNGVENARHGGAGADGQVTLNISHLDVPSAHYAVPVVVAPAVATLFLGTPDTRGERQLALAFDHLALNGEQAARYLQDLRSAVDRLARAVTEPLAAAEPTSTGDLVERIATRVAAITGSPVAPKLPLGRQGLSSAGAVRLSAELSAEHGVTLSPMVVWRHPTVLALAAHIAGTTTTSGPLALDTHTRDDEAIAVIGIGCRFPAGVTSPEELWQLLIDATDATGEMPLDRGWDLEALRERVSARRGGFLDDIAGFDAAFFAISPREAEAMEPQQRLLLATAWESIERARIVPASLAGTRTGVFAGMMPSDYAHHHRSEPSAHLQSGVMPSIASGRIAYTLGLAGPAISVDTACSSSLTAVHLACRSLRAGECDLALAGGATALATPADLIGFGDQGALAADGRCKPFADGADGIGVAEGAGMLTLQRLGDAQAAGRPVLAVIRGSALNQDGATNTLTAPSGLAQERVIIDALADAALTPADVDAVEAHGTGTSLGDPIEVEALMAAYGGERTRGPLLLGSIKSNLGHTQATAGVAGLIKGVLALQHEMLPPTLHAERPTPLITWDDRVQLVTRAQPWPAGERPRRIGVSSFGASGTNAHLILQEAPAGTHPEVGRREDTPTGRLAPLVWPLSARSPEALCDTAARLARHVEGHPALPLADVGHSLATTRTHHPYRAAIALGPEQDRDTALAALHALASGEEHPSVFATARPATGSDRRLVWVFPGHGAQRVGMGVELYGSEPVFRQHLDACARALAPWVAWDLLAVLRQDAGAPDLAELGVVQPALWAVMVSLARLWESYGIVPDAVIGHSQGEVAAAHIAGALTLEDAARIVALRSRTMDTLMGTGGGTAFLTLGEAEAVALVESYEGRLSLAVVNGPASTVVSGEDEALAELRTHCAEQGIPVRVRTGTIAVHGPMMDGLRQQILSELAPVSPRPTRYAFHSTVDGYPHDTALSGEQLDAEYWWHSVRRVVRFQDTVHALLDAGHSTYLEVSPRPTLLPALQHILDTVDPSVGSPPPLACGTLGRKHPDRATLPLLYCHGHLPDWSAVHPGAQSVDLPTYAFRPEHHWLTAGPGDLEVPPGATATGHPLLGTALEWAGRESTILVGQISCTKLPWLADHAVQGVPLLPAAAVTEVVLHAGHLIGLPWITELVLQRTLFLDRAQEVQLTVEHTTGEFTLYARSKGPTNDEPWQLCASGELTTAVRDNTPRWSRPDSARHRDAQECYAELAEAGYVYGPTFSGITALWRDNDTIYAQAKLPAGLDAKGFGIHPALLDAALQPLLLGTVTGGGVRLPFTLSGVTLHATGSTTLDIRIRPIGADAWRVETYDPAGAPVLTVDSVTTRPYQPAVEQRHPTVRRDLLQLSWTPQKGVIPEGTADDVLYWTAPEAEGDILTRTRELLHQALSFLQEWLADAAQEHTRLLVITRQAVATHPGEPVDPAGAALWGLVRSAQSEHPGRVVLLDHDGSASHAPVPEAVRAALTAQVPQVAWRDGVAHLPALRSRTEGTGLDDWREGTGWRMDTTGATHTVDDLTYQAEPERPLSGWQVRLRVRAAGLNSSDVAICLGRLHNSHGFGVEAVGTVIETGSDVTRQRQGDRVMGLVPRAFAPTTVADERLLIPVPEGWSDLEAAVATVSYGTAYHALVTLAEVSPGQRVLIHTGTGGEGHAAIRLAQHLGAEVYATAPPAGGTVLESLGVPAERIAGPHGLEFESTFRDAIGGAGMDAVLSAVENELTDTSLRLLAPGGHFVELGRSDLRDPDEVAVAHPGVDYRSFSFTSLGIPQLQSTLSALAELFTSGALTPLPTTGYDIRQTAEALRLMSDARHTTRLALTLPTRIDPQGTVLITGGTGTLAGIAARQLAAHHPGIRLLLVSRQGADAPGVSSLTAELTDRGADVVVMARDLTAPDAVRNLVEEIGTERPLTAVLHTAAQLADAPITVLTPEQMDRVLAVKAGVAWQLHQATADLDLAAFVLYSSVAGVFGLPGQGNYAAANVFLDALAHHRHLLGLPATSLAWGLWEPASAGTHLTDADRARLERAGFAPIAADHGGALLDHALAQGAAALVPAPLTRAVRTGLTDEVHPLLHHLIRPARRTATVPGAGDGSGSLVTRLAAVAPERRSDQVLGLLRGHAATILGRSAPHDIDPEASFRVLGFDSLTALELRNALARSTGIRLSPTLIFDHPTPQALSAYLLSELIPTEQQEAEAPHGSDRSPAPDLFDNATTDELINLALGNE
ncbi:SDR family NAD(P)-dependent oxidoreductase [Streptomyces sp. NPDC020965]|uniref:SDR family NAD(P)-dependent oxidoreductase n=1 Tax=Streptomyces sp. NPDC020965 TaxID=3365105 RepID=UPI0037888051